MSSVSPTIVIITHHANELLASALESIEAQYDHPVWVLHSHNKRLDWRSWCRSYKRPSTHHYQWLDSNVGYATAVNWAFQNLSGPLLILNDDVQVQTDCIHHLLQAHQQSPRSVLQPYLYLSEDTSRIENTGHRIHVDGMNSAVGRGLKVVESTNPQRLCFSGAAIWIPEVVYRHPYLQQMDPDLSPFGEDVDYALRCIRYGFQIVTVPNARVLHHWGGSYTRYSDQKVTWVESHRVQAKLRSMPWWMIVVSPLSTALRYYQSSGDIRIPTGQRSHAAQAAILGVIQGYTRAPRAIRKRFGESFVMSDWEFTKAWWHQR